MATFAEKFVDILGKQKSITEAEETSLIRDFKERSQDALIDFLLEEGLVPKNEILRALSTYYQVPSFDVVGYLFDHDLVHSFPQQFLRFNAIMPADLEEGILLIVTTKPNEPDLATRISQYFPNATIEFVVSIKQDILDAIREFYGKSLTTEGQEEFETEEDSIVDEFSEE